MKFGRLYHPPSPQSRQLVASRPSTGRLAPVQLKRGGGSAWGHAMTPANPLLVAALAMGSTTAHAPSDPRGDTPMRAASALRSIRPGRFAFGRRGRRAGVGGGSLRA